MSQRFNILENGAIRLLSRYCAVPGGNDSYGHGITVLAAGLCLLWVTIVLIQTNRQHADNQPDDTFTPQVQPITNDTESGNAWPRNVHSQTTRQVTENTEPVDQSFSLGRESTRTQLIDYASTLIQSRNSAASITPLKQYLEFAYDDVYLMSLLARAYKEDGQLNEAITTYQEALRFATDETSISIFHNQINLFISYHIQQSRENNSLQDSLSLLQYLVQAPPYTPGFYIRLAHIYEEMHRPEEAIQTLYYIQYDTEMGQQAQHLIEKILASR